MFNDSNTPGSYTKEVKQWLNKRFAATDKSGRYFSHEPIYGYADGPSEPDRLSRLSRTYQIIQVVNRLDFKSFVDIGGAEGYWSNIIRHLFRVPCLTCDLSCQANLMARLLYGVDGVTLDIDQIPIRDGMFDLVMCSETLEHVPDPVHAVRELSRVSRKYVLITTPLARTDEKRKEYLRLTEQDHQPHRHLHYFTKQDLACLLGKDAFVKGLRSIGIHPLLLELDKVSLKRRGSVPEHFVNFALRLDSAFARTFRGYTRDVLALKGLNGHSVRDLEAREAKLDVGTILRFLVRENRISPEKVAEELRKIDRAS